LFSNITLKYEMQANPYLTLPAGWMTKHSPSAETCPMWNPDRLQGQ